MFIVATLWRLEHLPKLKHRYLFPSHPQIFPTQATLHSQPLIAPHSNLFFFSFPLLIYPNESQEKIRCECRVLHYSLLNCAHDYTNARLGGHILINPNHVAHFAQLDAR